jgi:hypothetical protein
VVIALLMVGVILVTAFVSRWRRALELRFEGFTFAGEASRALWEEICARPFQVFVAHQPGHLSLADKEREIRKYHRLGREVPMLFVEARLGDPSDFYQAPLMQVVREHGYEVIRLSRCTSIAHVLAAVALECRHAGEPPQMHFSWSGQSPLTANLHFLLFGEGNIPWLVRALVIRAEPDVARQPRVIIG